MQLKRLGVLGAGLLVACGRTDDHDFFVGPSVGGVHSVSGSGGQAGTTGPAGSGGQAGTSFIEEKPPDEPAGTHRLKPWQLETEGTSPLLLGITDSENDAHCVFLHDSAGTLRCLPKPLELGLSHNGDGKPAHPDCSTPVFVIERPIFDALLGKPISLALPRPTCEPQRYSTYFLKTASDLGNPPECFVADQSNYFFEVTLSPALPDDTWQEGTEIDGPTLAGGRLRIKQFESADGARFFSRIVDDNFGGSTCSPATYTSTPCLPPHTTPWFFSDEHCTERLGRAPTCETPAYVDNVGMKLALGEEYVGPVWNQPHGGCYAWMPAPDRPPERYFHLGAPLQSGLFAELAWRFSGTGRLRQNGLPGDGGATVFVDDAFAERPRYYDVQANKACTPLPAPDGNRYCVPDDIPEIARFNAGPDVKAAGPYVDSACATLGYSCYADCSTAKMIEGLAGVDQHISGVYSLREVPAAYNFDGTNCVEAPKDGVSRYFELGSERPWTDWPALREANALSP